MEKNYIGNKGGQGIKEQLINHFPSCHRYFSLFFGKGGFEKCNLTKGITWICAEKDVSLHDNAYDVARTVFNDYDSCLDSFEFSTNDFVFADPPYMFSTRRSRKKYYKHEFNDDDHIKFLTRVHSLKCMCMITHPENDLYNEFLESWFKIPMRYQTRGGMFEDCIYLNYNSCSIELYNYSCIGSNFIERQQIKRKRANFIKKFEALSFHEQRAIMQHIK